MKRMKAVSVALLVVAVVLVSMDATLGRREYQDEREAREREREDEGQCHYFQDLEPGKPKEQLKTEGGTVEEWEHYKALEDASVSAGRLLLNPRGLVLPIYMDNHELLVVLRGTARVGLVLPLGDRAIHRHVYRVETGDVIAIPKGVVSWFYNDGKEQTEIVGIAYTTSGEEQYSRARGFFLAGAGSEDGRFKNVLEGFDQRILAQAWDVDEDTVKRILESQKGSAIVQVGEGIQLPDVTADQPETDEGNLLFASFVYRLARSDPDLRVGEGGELRVLNRYKLPVLKHLDFGLNCVKLEKNAMVAPSWSVNAHKIIYIVRGSGKIQVVRQNGKRALDAEVKEGSLVVVPRFFPVVVVAGSDGLDYFSVLTSDLPLAQFLAGRNSVFKGMPVQVAAESYKIDADLERKVRERGTKHAIILPPSSSGDKHSKRSDRSGRRDIEHDFIGMLMGSM